MRRKALYGVWSAVLGCLGHDQRNVSLPVSFVHFMQGVPGGPIHHPHLKAMHFYTTTQTKPVNSVVFAILVD